MLPLGPHLVSSSANGWKKISSPYLPRKTDYQNDGPQIISVGEEHFASPGERVSLPCRVKDLGTMVRLWKQAKIYMQGVRGTKLLLGFYHFYFSADQMNSIRPLIIFRQ